jgi:malate dehydrogenase (oxaloacetate-decarboxylating)(NADP+)
MHFHPKILKPKITGSDVLHDPLWNKGTAFSGFERDQLGLRGLLPPRMKSLEEQSDRVLKHLEALDDRSRKNLYLQDLQNRNETLYYNVLVNNIDEMAPLVYTPTVGEVCEKFGSQYTRARGMYFSRDDVGLMSTLVHNWPSDDVHVIVVTDGSRILGLGDLGVNGMGIPIGKLALYCACGGIAPHRVLPITLDVGTNNPALIDDPDYLGTRSPRLEGEEYVRFVDEFVQACFSRWPNCLVQFEDFESLKAVPLLERYRHKYRVFNDDIQGTGSVTLSGLLSAMRNAGTNIKDARVLCAGAGSSGLGVCQQIMDGMIEAGLSPEEAKSRFVACTSKGSLGRADGANGDPNHKRGLNFLQAAWINEEVSDGLPIADAVEQFKPNILLGLSTVGGLFDEKVVKTVAKYHDRPIIMPMSNPTDKAECSPEQAYTWTDGRAVVATGSPFPSHTMPDGTTFIPSQCNNMYIFPGVGLAASIAGVSHITDRMLYLAAEACTNTMTEDEIAEGRTFPKLGRIREVSKNVAVAVINEGIEKGMCPKLTQRDIDKGIEKLVTRKMYFPNYVPLVN